ncbi:MAG: hypothetical protein AAF291_04045 [Pseudomonadota bacterium]
MLRGLAAALALLSPVSHALAQTPVQVELDAPFVHEGSGITVPSAIGRFDRTSVTDFTDEQLNIAIHLLEASGETTLTLFIYRAATPNLSIWGDFAALAMVNDPSVGTLAPGSYFLGRFTPPNASGDGAALHARALLEGGKARSTGLSIFAHNDWIVKLRATSQTLSDDQITSVMGKVLSKITMEPSETIYPSVTFVQPCKKPMKFGKGVAVKQYSGVGRVVVSLQMKEFTVAERGTDASTKPWCRDTQSTLDYAIYRRDNSKWDYFLALSDGGFGAYVERTRTMGLMGEVTGYVVKKSDGITETSWPLFDKRPHPALIRNGFGRIAPYATQDIRPDADGEFTVILPNTPDN